MFFPSAFKRRLLGFWRWAAPGGYRPERHYMRGANRPAVN
jgi:hypothetical protein